MKNDEIAFNLEWLSGEYISAASIAARVGDDMLWPVRHDESAKIEVFADDLLAFLAENWHSLFLEQTYPVININTTRPSRLRSLAEERWEESGDENSEEESLLIENFERTHNLSSCFAGVMDAPPLWFMRRGNVMIIDDGRDILIQTISAVEKCLDNLGKRIAERLAQEEKFAPLIEAWKNRAKRDPLILLSTATGLSTNVAKDLVDAKALSLPTSFSEAANDNDEIRIAARITGALTTAHIRAILFSAKSVPQCNDTFLREMKISVSDELQSSSYRKAHDIGAGVAIAARKFLDLSSAQKVDIESTLNSLKIFLKVEQEISEEFKGLAIWGHKHGPGIIVAKQDRGSPYTNAFQRVTIAHELGHLLMDGDHAIGAVDVLNGRCPIEMEQRAKSFAGEFLLPAKSAADAWEQRNHPTDAANLTELIEALRKKYGVTKAVAAWKLEHGVKSLGAPDISRVLNKIVPLR